MAASKTAITKKAAKGGRKDLAPGASPISGYALPERFRWVKGMSGNPKGRPPSFLTLTSELKRQFGDKAPDNIARQYFPNDYKGKTWLQVYVAAGLYHSTDKILFDATTYKEIFGRMDGKMPEFPVPDGDESDLNDEPVAIQPADAYKMAVGLLREMIRRGVFPAQVFIGDGRNGEGNGDGR